MTELRPWIDRVVEAISTWQDSYGRFPLHPALEVSDADLAPAVEALVHRLTTDNYPFFHPHYAGQMLRPPHPAAVIGYVAAMLINPNNHSLDGGPATARMEKEVVVDLARMLGMDEHLGHLTTSGTIANLEALWIARELNPGMAIAFSADAHYTHTRMCQVLGVDRVTVPVDAAGRMDVTALDALLAEGHIGTVVATLSTTGLGALDPVHEIAAVVQKHGARLHVDAAYGGFFALIADDTDDGVASAPYRALSHADSIVIDPHKHGLQPYGCGAVLFRDPSVVDFFQHDSPYTYFSSDELHLGEISLECSRAGAAAAALWLTLQVIPPTTDALGATLRPGRAAALRWHDLLLASDVLTPYQVPDTDIVTYLPVSASMSALDAESSRIFTTLAEGSPDQQIHLATYVADANALRSRGFTLTEDLDHARILRSVLMKPEHFDAVPTLHARIEGLLR